VSELLVFGHSVAYGGGASTLDRRYPTLVAARLDLHERNLAVGGAVGCWDERGRDPGDGGWQRVVEQVQPGAPRGPAIAHFGLNDLAALGPDHLRPLQEALRTMLTWLQAGDGALVPQRRLFRRAAPIEFDGTRVDVVIGVEPGDDLEVRLIVDGSDAGGAALRGADVCDLVAAVRNGVTVSSEPLEAGRHELRVEGARPLAWSVPAAAPSPVAVALGHRVFNWDWYADWPHRCSDADVPVLNAALAEVCDGVGDAVVTVDVDAVLGKDPGLFADDDFYPNDEGHRRIGEAVVAAVET
jgi:lysophospholipase L1-like esterase